MIKRFLLWFEDIDKNDINLVGGKGANLGEMVNAGLPVPYGFFITAQAYFQFIKQANLEKKIKDSLAIVNYDTPGEIKQISLHIQNLILTEKIPENLALEIIDYYENLTLREEKYFNKKLNINKIVYQKIKNLYRSPLVAVRSSATAEDLPNASFAGQQETYLNVRGEAYLLQKIKKCWASLFTERAIFYRHNQGFDHLRVGLAVVIQRMIQSEKSGIGFSVDPVSNDKTKIIIEAIYGLGEYIVQGKVTPDHYEVDKKSLIILKKIINYQNLKLVKSGIANRTIKLSKKIGKTQKLSDQDIIKIALLIKEIENHYYFPQDIEWAIENDKIFVVQSRPITTLNHTKAATKYQLKDNIDKQLLFTGAPASPGIGVGPVKIIFSPSQIFKVKKGDILVTPQTNPDYVPAMKKTAAIITEKGGRTSHAAIVSRELGIPAVVGAKDATKILKNETIVSVNGETGEIFSGNILSSNKINSHAAVEKPKKISTQTKVYVNLAEPEHAEKIARLDVDGVGLLRAEFMIAQIGTHPKEFIRQKKEKIFITKLADNLLKFVKAFNPRPIIYRATDFKTNEYRHLKAGDLYEPKEENPMLGYRGASRYIAEPQIFNLELAAIKKIWQADYKNLHLMIPFIRVPWELIKIKELIHKSGLFLYPDFKLLIMVEVPSCALALEDFIKIGIDGISIGTNDLTMMLLGVDRDNQEVAQDYDERNPVVVKILESIVNICNKNHITSSICGQAASDYPDLVEILVKAGITSVSINPDAIERTRELISHFEKKLNGQN